MTTSLDRFFFCFAFFIIATVCEASDPSHGYSLSIAKYRTAWSTVLVEEAPTSQFWRTDHVELRALPERATRPTSSVSELLLRIRGGGWIIPAGYNPFGYKITPLGVQFLSYDGSLDCDVGRFLASLKDRKRFATLKGQWLEVLRVSKTGQSMRIYKNLQELVTLCLKMGLID
jgi:hypothetical protein